MKTPVPHDRGNLASRLVALFINSRITPLLALIAVVLGAVAIHSLPREEEPQINVTLIDLFVDLPATPAREVEQRVCRPLEKLLRELPGAEYVYSTSNENKCLVTLRYYVGYAADRAIVEANSKVNANLDVLPAGASKPLIKVRSIDDVPVLTLTLWSEHHDHYSLRRIAAQMDEEIKGVKDVAETRLFGGQKREIRVYPDRAALQANKLMFVDLFYSLNQGNSPAKGGDFRAADAEVRTDSSTAFRTAEDVANAQVRNYDGTIIASIRDPLRVADIATVQDGPGEVTNYVHFTPGKGYAGEARMGEFHPAVTLSVAKLPGTSATEVVKGVMAMVDSQQGRLIPADVHLEVTRDYGHTATEKSDELLFHMAIAVVSVSLLIALALGTREAVVVAVAIPVTLALTLGAFYLLGYTLNRITLFALIFSIGILVDDPIVDVENIVRYLRDPKHQGRPITEVVSEAVNEVRSPLILATLAVIFAILPMAFVRGLMGPYMRPIPVGASTAMLLSMGVAFVLTPWVAARVLRHLATTGDATPGPWAVRLQERFGPAIKHFRAFVAVFRDDNHGRDGEGTESRLTHLYRRVMEPLLASRRHRMLFLGGIVGLLLLSVALIPTGLLKVKMLPFDNKSEFQVILDMPEGTTLERTQAVAQEMARSLATLEEVRDVEVYAGLAAPFNFNGLIRRYYLRAGSSKADLQVNLVDRHERDLPSHEVAKKARELIKPIAERHQARMAVAEVPPGPPVQQTLVAEIYGPTEEGRRALARSVEDILRGTQGVVDIDDCLLRPQRKLLFKVDPERAAFNHIDPEMCSTNLSIASAGRAAGVLHDPREREQVDVRLQLPESQRSSIDDLLAIPVRGRDFRFVPLGEMMGVEETTIDQRITHKNLQTLLYVQGDVAGEIESPVYAITRVSDRIDALRPNVGENPAPDIYFGNQPPDESRYAIKWDGEMQVTYEVFRDLGLAFAAVLVLIYILMVAWFESYLTPLVIMSVIPFSLVGILPAHVLAGSFFSATSMIGFIAGAGIVVRNSIILVDFIRLRIAEGMPLKEAVIDAGAVRFRPMVLTAAAVVVGSVVILFDPIFQGLALSLMAGEVASLFIGRLAVPVLYYRAYRDRHPG
jgi:multidrug efflux pump subunit AcrB